MLPLQPTPALNLQGKEILILRGEFDTVIPAESTDRLLKILEKAGADVTVRKISAGHGITAKDRVIAAQWLSRKIFQNQGVSRLKLVEKMA
jgi:predicted esterase